MKVVIDTETADKIIMALSRCQGHLNVDIGSGAVEPIRKELKKACEEAINAYLENRELVP